jgi:hypothetical protein
MHGEGGLGAEAHVYDVVVLGDSRGAASLLAELVITATF